MSHWCVPVMPSTALPATLRWKGAVLAATLWMPSSTLYSANTNKYCPAHRYGTWDILACYIQHTQSSDMQR